ncbi:glycosyltransferase family 4 protein, partial [Omnitrophica bacterium]|nr:glycosyltransferase family 4 protein [Candidatus Omnitrophota bacterium]
MKIAVWYNLPNGGGKRAWYYFVDGLKKLGHHVESWCPSTSDQEYLPLDQLITEHILPVSWQPVSTNNRSNNDMPSNAMSYKDTMCEIKKKIAKHILPYSVREYRNIKGRVKQLILHSKKCADQINNGGFDLLLATSCRFFASPFIGRFIKIPKVLYLHEPCRQLYEANSTLKWVGLPQSSLELQGRRLQAKEEVTNARAFDSILVNSLFTREYLLKVYGLDSKVCYPGVDTGKFINKKKHRENCVVG